MFKSAPPASEQVFF